MMNRQNNRRQKYMKCIVLFLVLLHNACSISDRKKQRIYERMEIHDTIERIEPVIIKLPGGISDISGINTPNSAAVLNSKGEIAVTEHAVFLQYDGKPYNVRSKTMVGYNHDPANFFIKWDEDYKASVIPFSPLQKPDDIQVVAGVGEFSPDGQWFDMFARLDSNGSGNPDERFVYHVNEHYPIGISPPVRLGLTSDYIPGAFMMHDTLGPCYILLDEEYSRLVLVFKLHDGLPIIAGQLQSYLE